MLRLILALISLPFFAFVAYAAPVVGTASIDGSTISVSGSGFGTKTQSNPLVFDDLDDNTTGKQNGDQIRGDTCSHYGAWDSGYLDSIPTYTNSNNRSNSTLSSYHYIKCDDNSLNHAPLSIEFSSSHTPTVMISFWMRYTQSNMSGGGNIKIYRMKDDVSLDADLDSRTSLQVGSGNGWESKGFVYMYSDSDGSSNTVDWPATSGIDTSLDFEWPLDGGWEQHILFFKAGSNGQTNGSAIVWVDGVKLEDTDAMETWASIDAWKAMTFGWYCANYDSGNNYLQFDDIYIDNTWQSVWIGDDPDWDSCTNREPQIPTAWNATSITATLNQGGLSDGTAYLFVIDEDGVASSGKIVTLGGASPECDADHLELCTTQEICEAASLNWCGGACQVAECPISSASGLHLIGVDVQ